MWTRVKVSSVFALSEDDQAVAQPGISVPGRRRWGPGRDSSSQLLHPGWTVFHQKACSRPSTMETCALLCRWPGQQSPPDARQSTLVRQAAACYTEPTTACRERCLQLAVLSVLASDAPSGAAHYRACESPCLSGRAQPLALLPRASACSFSQEAQPVPQRQCWPAEIRPLHSWMEAVRALAPDHLGFLAHMKLYFIEDKNTSLTVRNCTHTHAVYFHIDLSNTQN